MKVFIAETKEKGRISSTNFHWCDDKDLLMFGQFQLGNGNPSEVAMHGILSRKYTTNIIVKDLKIDEDFYKELITESIEKSMGCKIDNDGNYNIEMGFKHKFNVNDIIKELVRKANCFNDGQKVKCNGRTLTAV